MLICFLHISFFRILADGWLILAIQHGGTIHSLCVLSLLIHGVRSISCVLTLF